MSKWDDVIKEYEVDIEKIADDYIKATNVLPYTVSDIKNVFSVDELEEVASFIKEMREATEDNQRKAQIISKSTKIVEGLLKLSKVLI